VVTIEKEKGKPRSNSSKAISTLINKNY